MKLIATAKRLEDLAARMTGLYGRRQPAGLVWSAHEELVIEPENGEYVAVDVHESGREIEGVKLVRTVERLVVDPQDLGTVFGADGGRVGRVVERDGSLITIAYDAVGEVDQAPAAIARPRAARVVRVSRARSARKA